MGRAGEPLPALTEARKEAAQQGVSASSQDSCVGHWTPAGLSSPLPPTGPRPPLGPALLGGSWLRWRREPARTMTAVYANGGGLVNAHCARWERRDSAESGGQTTECNKEGEERQPRQLTPFEKLTQDMSHDEKVVREITLGKRIGFYRIRGEIGSGNFSQVKLGIHSLTKGRISLPKFFPRDPGIWFVAGV